MATKKPATKKQYTKADLLQLIKRYHLEADMARDGQDYCVYSPVGYKIAQSQNHVRCEPHRGDARGKQEAIHELVEFLMEKPVLIKCKAGCDCGWDE
jgi:hypothetical protein